MNYYYDLHIHSALSACADDDMTPHNILNMCKLKGLDIIAICDHNACDNIRPFLKLAKNKDILCIPAIEITTKEDVHLLAYFKDATCLYEFTSNLSVSSMKNNPDIFGHQYILSENDEIIGERAEMLSAAIDFSIDKCVELIRFYQGIPVPAHIDRASYSILSNLGFIPENLSFKTVEIKNPEYLSQHSFLKEYTILVNSDAHCLSSIHERENYIKLNDETAEIFAIL